MTKIYESPNGGATVYEREIGSTTRTLVRDEEAVKPETVLNRYGRFVAAVTSEPSTDLTAFMNRLDRLDGNFEQFGVDPTPRHGPNVNVPLLITAGLGLGSEAGEFQEIVKKILFQGKTLDEQTHFHLKRELGDVMWYWINACHALGFDPNDVLETNVEKLKSRYPSGEFSIWHSENRKEGDV